MSPTRRLRRVGVVAAVVLAGEVVLARPAAAFPGEGVIRDAVGSVAGSAFDRVVAALVNWLLGGVQTFVAGVFRFLGTTSTPDVNALWFTGARSPFAAVRQVTAVLLVGFVLLAIIQGLVHSDVGSMLTRVLGGVPLAIFGTAAVTVVTAQLLALIDAMSFTIIDPRGPDAARFLKGLIVTSASGSGFAVGLVAAVTAVAAMLLWAELLVRAALVYILVALSPLAFAASVWPAARTTARRLLELLVAMIVSKLVVAVALAVGIAAVGSVGLDGGADTAGVVGQLLVGAVVLGIAAFAPFLTVRLFPLAESAGVAHGVSRAPVRTTISAVYLTNSVGRLAAGAATGGSAALLPAATTATKAATDGFALGRATTSLDANRRALSAPSTNGEQQ